MRLRPVASVLATASIVAGLDLCLVAQEKTVPSPDSPEQCRGVFITEEDPPSRHYLVVKKEIQVGKKFYGSHDDALML